MQAEPSTAFAAWAAHNGKLYAPEELQTRLPVFKANVARQLERLSLTDGTVEVNGLADLSTDEFRATHLGHVSRSTITELGCVLGPVPTLHSGSTPTRLHPLLRQSCLHMRAQASIHHLH